ncbi:unnamed protein product [Leuciscus chuanchicus]
MAELRRSTLWKEPKEAYSQKGNTFIPPFCAKGQQGLEKRGYYLNVVHPTSRTPMFLFHSSGVAHFPTAITGREIKTGPSGGIASPPADGCVHVNGLADDTEAQASSSSQDQTLGLCLLSSHEEDGRN